MSNSGQVEQHISKRVLESTTTSEPSLGPLSHLPGVWKNTGQFQGHGWNMIALPFPTGSHDYRLLNNQYNETLTFQLVDKNVPNRGMNGDQEVFTIDYVQAIDQIAADDAPRSGLAGGDGLAIHHEPGLWLHMKDHITGDLDIARLSSIPHGDALMALGKSQQSKTGFDIPNISGLPIGVDQDLHNPYLQPYLHFHEQPFKDLFDPTQPNELLDQAILPFFQQKKVANVTQLKVDSSLASGGVNNIPFITKQANATEVSAIFWIYELTEKLPNGEPRMLLQYTQTVMLEFFERKDGQGLIKWPHVSINTLEKQP
ncbi:heme-binding protein (plasmid) [Pseudoalteromonas sp. T1lg65]|uniref:heme-binding protein n=1 Tax=Pseudoalteromonas sp. T1lg65 TaxID=2077101 RepID=UPI003F7A5C77